LIQGLVFKHQSTAVDVMIRVWNRTRIGMMREIAGRWRRACEEGEETIPRVGARRPHATRCQGAKRAAHGIQQWRVWSMEEVRAKMNRQLQDSWMEISTLRGDARLYEEKEREMADRLVELEASC